MARWNLRVTSFVSGATTFNAKATGVYVTGGPVSGAEITDRMVKLPYGGVHDLDGTADAPRTPPLFYQDFFFVGDSPYDHTEYNDLLALEGKHGTLNFEIPTTGVANTFSALARLMRVEGEWTPIYMTNRKNSFKARAYWQLKAYPA